MISLIHQGRFDRRVRGVLAVAATLAAGVALPTSVGAQARDRLPNDCAACATASPLKLEARTGLTTLPFPQPPAPPMPVVGSSRSACGGNVVVSDGLVDYVYFFDRLTMTWQSTALIGHYHACCGGQVITRNIAGHFRAYRYDAGWRVLDLGLA